VKYSGAGRAVRFEIARAGAELVCTIRDQGIGIPEADREWLFSAFHRGHNVAGRAGTGLGLVIVKRCVDLHRGKILVESKVGKRHHNYREVANVLPGNREDRSQESGYRVQEVGSRGSRFTGRRTPGSVTREWLTSVSSYSS
jgi:signal transduction histidine kinase